MIKKFGNIDQFTSEASIKQSQKYYKDEFPKLRQSRAAKMAEKEIKKQERLLKKDIAKVPV